MHLQLSCFVLSVLVSLISDVVQRSADETSVPGATAFASTTRGFGFSLEGTEWTRRQPESRQWHFVGGGVRGADLGEDGSWLSPREGSRHAVLSSGGSMRRSVHLEGGQHVLTLQVARRGARSAPLVLRLDDALITTWAVGGAGRSESLVALVSGAGNRVLTLSNPEGGAAVVVDQVELSQLVTGAQVLTDGFEQGDAGPASEWLLARAGVRRAAQKSDGSWLTSRRGGAFAFLEAGGVVERTVTLETGVQHVRLSVARADQASTLTVYLGSEKLGEVVPTLEGFAHVSLPRVWMESGEVVVRVVNSSQAEVFVDELSIEVESPSTGAPSLALVQR